jgi:hypothetical protein
MSFAKIKYRNKMTSFFNDTKIDDLPTKNDAEIDHIACCQTKKLAYEIFRLAAETKGFPYNDPELMKRSINQNLNIYQMRPYNELAIKIMRKFGKLKVEDM